MKLAKWSPIETDVLRAMTYLLASAKIYQFLVSVATLFFLH